jgi:hypothetical protein
METNALGRIEEQLAQLLQPLTEQLAQLDQEIETREREIGELKKARTRLRTALKGLMPSENGAKPRRTRTNSAMPSEAKVQALREWLREHGELSEESFYTSGLLASYGGELPIKNASSLGLALQRLHDEGWLVLDRKGAGGSRHYKVVA